MDGSVRCNASRRPSSRNRCHVQAGARQDDRHHSQIGSIADNGSGGWGAYRTSEGALNAACGRWPWTWQGAGLRSPMLHPGWVQTDMGGRGAPLDPESVAGCAA
jgi:NAD(P)-dependent dehydrogenase (short-subunit alcohol dehydrogenase family)